MRPQNGLRQVGKSGKSRKVCNGSGSWAKENEILKNFMLQGSQSTGKYTTSKCSYILKSTSYLATLAYMPSPHSFSIGNNNWMAWPTSLHPAPTNAPQQASFPSPAHYYLARHWFSGARNAMNFVCRKSKIREKTDLGARGRRQS